MGKPNKKPDTSSSTPVKSKKPRFKGLNHIPNIPKAFRCHACKGLYKGVLHMKKKPVASSNEN